MARRKRFHAIISPALGRWSFEKCPAFPPAHRVADFLKNMVWHRRLQNFLFWRLRDTIYPDSLKIREKFLAFSDWEDFVARMIQSGFLGKEDRGKLIAMARWCIGSRGGPMHSFFWTMGGTPRKPPKCCCWTTTRSAAGASFLNNAGSRA